MTVAPNKIKYHLEAPVKNKQETQVVRLERKKGVAITTLHTADKKNTLDGSTDPGDLFGPQGSSS